MFGSQFFGLDSSASPPQIRMAGEFWIFWVIVVGVTIVVFWLRTTVQRRREGRPGMMKEVVNRAIQCLANG